MLLPVRLLYTAEAMVRYQLSKHSPYQPALRIFSGGAIFSLLGILLFSLFEPAGLSDSLAHSIGWAAGVIVLASVLGLTLLSVKDAIWTLKRKLSFELSDNKIIQRSDDAAAIEIPLNNIESLYENRSLLLIRGGEPTQQISIPREIDDFDALKRQLASYHPIAVIKAIGALENSGTGTCEKMQIRDFDGMGVQEFIV